jgi:hypothetical protein
VRVSLARETLSQLLAAETLATHAPRNKRMIHGQAGETPESRCGNSELVFSTPRRSTSLDTTPRSRFVSSLFHDCPSKLPEKRVDIRGTPLSEAAIQSVVGRSTRLRCTKAPLHRDNITSRLRRSRILLIANSNDPAATAPSFMRGGAAAPRLLPQRAYSRCSSRSATVTDETGEWERFRARSLCDSYSERSHPGASFLNERSWSDDAHSFS